MEELKQQCISVVQIWRNCGCLRSGSINEERIKAKLRYKFAIKDAILAADFEFNDDLASDLCKKKTLKVFGNPGGKILFQKSYAD